MVIIKCDPSTFKQTRWYAYAIRFVAGGVITAVAGLVAKEYGPVVGGLFLAFPAIFPASATLIAKHEREKKEQNGSEGQQRGISAAAVNAAGAAMGSLGLAAFAAVTWWLIASYYPTLILAAATIAWFLVGCLIWIGWRVRHRWTMRIHRHQSHWSST